MIRPSRCEDELSLQRHAWVLWLETPLRPPEQQELPPASQPPPTRVTFTSGELARPPPSSARHGLLRLDRTRAAPEGADPPAARMPRTSDRVAVTTVDPEAL
jgi:hypothetical protein